MLWFVFWESVPSSGAPGPAGILAHGLGTAILGVVVAALICHFASYLAPGLMGMKTGLPLAVVGTSTYGVQRRVPHARLLHGRSAVRLVGGERLLLRQAAGRAGRGRRNVGAAPGDRRGWALAAAFVGLKGIHYVAKVATYLPLIPAVILLILTAKTFSGVGNFKPELLTAEGAVHTPSDSFWNSKSVVDMTTSSYHHQRLIQPGMFFQKPAYICRHNCVSQCLGINDPM